MYDAHSTNSLTMRQWCQILHLRLFAITDYHFLFMQLHFGFRKQIKDYSFYLFIYLFFATGQKQRRGPADPKGQLDSRFTDILQGASVRASGIHAVPVGYHWQTLPGSICWHCYCQRWTLSSVSSNLKYHLDQFVVMHDYCQLLCYKCLGHISCSVPFAYLCEHLSSKSFYFECKEWPLAIHMSDSLEFDG